MRLLNPSLTVGALIGAPTVREGFPARAQYYAVGALGEAPAEDSKGHQARSEQEKRGGFRTWVRGTGQFHANTGWSGIVIHDEVQSIHTGYEAAGDREWSPRSETVIGGEPNRYRIARGNAVQQDVQASVIGGPLTELMRTAPLPSTPVLKNWTWLAYAAPDRINIATAAAKQPRPWNSKLFIFFSSHTRTKSGYLEEG